MPVRCFLALLATCFALNVAHAASLDLLPAPKAAKVGEGRLAVPNFYVFENAKPPQSVYARDVLAGVFGPAPRSYVAKGNQVSVRLRLARGADEVTQAARALGLPAPPSYRWQEAFVLNCGMRTKDVVITGGPSGLVYGAYALTHLRRHEGDRLTVPRCAVSDWPTLLTRAYTGIPRDPKSSSFLSTLDWLARWRINAGYYEIYGDQGQDGAPEEVARIHEECAKRGIRLYGQLSHWRTELLLKRELCACNPEDVARIRRYAQEFLDRGCDGLILLFDDITQAAALHPLTCPLCKERFSTLAACQIELLRPMLEEGRKRGVQQLIMCPTPYYVGWPSTQQGKLDGKRYFATLAASELMKGVQVYHCQFRADEIKELEQAGLRSFIYWCNGFYPYDQCVPEGARVPGVWGGLGEAPFGWYTQRWDATQGLVPTPDAYEAFRGLPKLTQHAWLCGGGDWAFALWGCYCWDADRFAGVEAELLTAVYGPGTAEPYATYKTIARGWLPKLQKAGAVLPGQREAVIRQLEADAARLKQAAEAFAQATVASPDAALGLEARKGTAAQMTASAAALKKLTETARTGGAVVQIENERDGGNGTREQRMTIGDFWSRFSLRYSQTTDPDGTKHRTQWHFGSGLGMTGPSDRNWYDAGFVDVLVNGKSLDAFTPKFERVAGAQGDSLVATWSTDVGALVIRFSLWQGGLRMVGQWGGDPQAKLAVRLFTIPGAGWGAWTDMDKFVTTPSTTTPHGTPVTLQPGERWMFLADKTYDIPHEKAEGPCAVLFGDPLPQVTCDNGTYVVQIDADYPTGTKEFRLTIWDFHGLQNDEGLKTLQGIVAKGELP